ncbi:MAG TPA: cellulase family glycosylhydrolase [Caulobacteraceae bacterium]|jgi:hypothetical protein|nr:cellulase family glycosylhydrolase [Caulobacteraceae bacterium]
MQAVRTGLPQAAQRVLMISLAIVAMSGCSAKDTSARDRSGRVAVAQGDDEGDSGGRQGGGGWAGSRGGGGNLPFAAPNAVAKPLTPVSAVTVSGNQFLRDGRPFVPVGFVFSALLQPKRFMDACAQEVFCERRLSAREWLYGRGRFAGHSALDVAQDWGSNTIRYNVDQAALDPANPSYSAAYADEIRSAVRLARNRGFVVILTLFDGRNKHAPQAWLASSPKTPLDDATTLGAAVALAKAYGQDRGVMLELLNEPWSPGPPEQGWQLWLNGGVASQGRFAGQQFVGVNQIIRAMRAAGAKNVILLQGLKASMKGFPGGVEDPLGQVAYSVHPFFGNGEPDKMDWDGNFGQFASSHPMVLTAWNVLTKQGWCGRWGVDKPRQFLSYLHAHHIGMMAFALDARHTAVDDFETGAATPSSLAADCQQNSAPGSLIRQYFLSAN